MRISESLKENKSVQLKKHAKDWEDAIHILMKPLVESGAVKPEYPEAIIARTKEIGPFYALAPGLVMPHERGEMGALKDAFTFLTLDEQVEFPGNEVADVLIGFSATNSEIHVGEAIPQVIQIYDADENLDKIRSMVTVDELISFVEEATK